MKDVLYPDNTLLRAVYIIGWLCLLGLLFWIALGSKDVKVVISVIVISFLLMISHIHMMFTKK